jgi:NAD(P)-dependent dehydrogenase (short-subunit alcohol dehydrogenase family)
MEHLLRLEACDRTWDAFCTCGRGQFMKLKDRVVVITGSGAGIGRASALEFAREGANVVLADVNLAGARETAESIRQSGGIAHPVETDVADAGSVQGLVAETLRTFHNVHVLFNNAAIQINKTVEDTTVDEWNREIAVNLGGVFLCSKFFLPHLRVTKGAIVNMASVNGFFMEPICAGYCATKAAIIGLTKAMAIDHGKEGIRVNCICPGYIDAGLAEGYFQAQPDPAAARAAAGKLHALWRIGRPAEVGRVAVFLASDDASFVTGSAYVVDGGFSSGLPPSS